MLYSMSTQKDKKNYQAVLGETAGDLLPGAGFRQLFGLCYRARVTGETPARAVPGANNCSYCSPGENQTPATPLTRNPNPNNLSGYVPGKLPPVPILCKNGDNPVQALGGLRENPNKFSASRPRLLTQPHLMARFWGATTPPATPHGVTQLLRWFFATVSYRDLFGFYGIFCWGYVNHAIFSTIHEFLQLFDDLLSAEIINVLMGYMATSNH